MDVEVEITILKQRLEVLEAAASAGADEVATSGDAGAPVVVQFSQEVADELEALNVEITGLRWHMRDYHASSQAQLQQQLDDLRIGMCLLDCKLDELLKRSTA
ncbi:hypothetical protein ACFFR3_31405 [Nonomuraea salmonea]|uniref:PE domain-containing protein n=1 Tax=Nonomuraea salmonea TaxID=46181 RepID=A0ABV5NUL7_9ACTN